MERQERQRQSRHHAETKAFDYSTKILYLQISSMLDVDVSLVRDIDVIDE